MRLDENFNSIKERIAAAAARADRSPDDITLVAVSKRVGPEAVMAAIAAGHLVFGENYVQEALAKIPLVRKETRTKVKFHFIGKLQRNKAKKAVELFDLVETVDSVKLGLALETHCEQLNRVLEAYIQVNIGVEGQKSGAAPADCAKILRGLAGCRFLRINGLMAMPPYAVDSEMSRPYFIRLRCLAEELVADGLLGKHGPPELSMGMSGDFEVAIEEGATVVRVGTALFGPRPR